MGACMIVAEAGVNWNGDRAKIVALIEAAKASGASHIKFQAFNADALVARRKITDQNTIDLLRRNELTDADLDMIQHEAGVAEIAHFYSVFDPSQIERVLSRGACALKIGHAEAGWMELIKECDKHRGAVLCIISNPAWAGMYRPDGAESNPRRMWKDVHCVEKYPADGHNPELWRVGSREHHFAGFSSHYTDYRIPAAAALRGAEYIECHLMLGDVFDAERATMVNPGPGVWHYSDKKCNSRAEESEPEAAWSLYPYEFREMCALIRFHESLL